MRKYTTLTLILVMHRHILRFITGIIVSASVVVSNAQLTATHWLQPVDPYVPSAESMVWDMSQLPHLDSEIEASVYYLGDSLIEITLPTVRHTFMTSADTLRRVATESRFDNFIDSVRPVIATPLRTHASTYPVTRSGRSFHHNFFVSQGTITLYPDLSGTLILQPSDTITDVILRRTVERYVSGTTPARHMPLHAIGDSLRTYHSRETYVWTRPGAQFPFALTEVSRDSSLTSAPVMRSETWIRTDLHDLQQQRVYARSQNTTADATYNPLDLLRNTPTAALNCAATDNQRLAHMAGNAVIEQSPDAVTVSFPPGADYPADSSTGDITLLLTDILGRVYHSQTLPSTDRASIGFKPPAPGEYLLQLSTPSSSATRKIIIH